MLILFNVPNAVRKSPLLGACNFLLFRGPRRKLDLVGEQNTASHYVNELELGLDSSDTVLGFLTIGHLFDDLNTEVIIGIAFKALISVRRNLILPVSLGNGRSDIVRMKTAVGGHVVKLDGISVLDEAWRVDGVPSVRAIHRLTVDTKRLGHVLKEPQVVLIFVRVEGNLLLQAAGGVHKVVRVQIASLGIMMSD